MRHLCKSANISGISIKENLTEKSLIRLQRLTLGVLSCFFSNIGFAQIISWDFGNTDSTSFPSVTTANVFASNLTAKNNNGTTPLVTNASASTGYTGASGNYNAGAAVTVQTFNQSTSTFFESTLTPAPGFSVTINAINFGSRSTSTGPQKYSIRSSLNSFSSDIITGDLPADGTWNFRQNNLSISNTNTITIRIYGFGGTGRSSVNWRLDDLSLNVSVNHVVKSYRSRQNGNWENAATWESSVDGINWDDATTFPTRDDSSILIQQGRTVIVNSPVYLDQTIIEGTLELQTGGVLNINDGAGDDIKIATTGNLKISSSNDFATSIQQAAQANINILANGKISVGDGGATGSGYEEFATSDKNKWNDGAVFEYNSSSTFSIAGLTYFPGATAANVPVFKITKVGGSIPAAVNKDFLLNGLLELNTDVTFTGAGKKNFRNGIRGTAALSQSGAGKFYLTGDNAILDGISLKINLAQPMDLATSTVIPTSANVTISGSNISNSSKTFTINGMLDMTIVTITNSSGVINLNGIYRTAHPGGFSGDLSSIPSKTGTVNLSPGSTVELYANGDQALTARKDFSNLTFSGSGRKIPGGPFNPAGTVTIRENAIFDCSGKNIGDETFGTATSTNLTMSGNSRLIVDSYGPNPKMGGMYNLRGGVIEFKGSGATAETIRSKNYQNIEVTGTNVLMGEGNIYLNDAGTFTVKTGGIFSINDNTITGNGNATQKIILETGSVFRCGTNMGFNGAVISSVPIKSSSINADITNIILQKNATIEYTRKGDQPITIANNLVYQNLVLAESGNKTAPAGNLLIQGNFSITNAATFLHNNGTVIFNGSDAQTFSSWMPSTVFYNFTNQNSAGLSINSGLSVIRKFSLQDYSKIFVNNDITFLSSKSQTAFISQLATNVNLNYNAGKFVVERFINTNTMDGGHGKSWQFISTPAFGETISNTWQEKALPGITGYGTWITGPAGISKGFDGLSAAPSMKYYNDDANSWTGITGTDISLENQKGYMVFVRGDRKSNSVNSPPTPTILRTKGKLYTPSFPPPLSIVLPKHFQSVGNPYASAIDFSKLHTSNIGSYYIAWDPTLGGDYGLGAYQTISAATNYKAVPGNTSIYNNYSDYRNIQSGQAFFVHNFTESNGFVSFSEDCKLEDNHHLVNRTSENEKQILLATLLYENGRLADGNAVVFDTLFSDNIDSDDAFKRSNSEENFGIATKNKIIAVEARSPIKVADTVFYNLSNLTKQNYVLSFLPENITSNSTAYLIDQYLNTETKVSLTDTSYYLFSVNSNLLSGKPDRFYIVFRSDENQKVFSSLSLTAILEGKNVKLEWETENENEITNYQIEHSTDGSNFTAIGAVNSQNKLKNKYNFFHERPVSGKNYYRIKIIKTKGGIEQSELIDITIPESQNGILIYPNPVKGRFINVHFINQAPGKYVLILYNFIGQKIMVKEFDVTGRNSSKNISIEKSTVQGILQLEVIKPGGSRILLPIMQ